jgi:hypothetical protein
MELRESGIVNQQFQTRKVTSTSLQSSSKLTPTLPLNSNLVIKNLPCANIDPIGKHLKMAQMFF